MKIQSSELYVNNKKVYHEGNKPRPQDINAADRSHTHNWVGDGGMKIYGAGDEVNFGGSTNSSTIHIGFRGMDSKPTPSVFAFGSGNGNATVKAKQFLQDGSPLALKSHAHNAVDVKFNNGKNFQELYEKGELRGQAGAKGDTGPSIKIFNTDYSYSDEGMAEYIAIGYTGTWVISPPSSSSDRVGDTVGINLKNTTRQGNTILFGKIVSGQGTNGLRLQTIGHLHSGIKGVKGDRGLTGPNEISTGTSIGSGISSGHFLYASGNKVAGKAITPSLINAADKSHSHDWVGDSSIKIYAHSSNEINFGGSNTSATLYLGYRATDNRPKPATYIFGTGNGTATIMAKKFLQDNQALALESHSHSGYASSGHSHSEYYRTTGGTVSGRINADGKISTVSTGSSWITGKTTSNASLEIKTQVTQSSYHPMIAATSYSGNVVNFGGLGDRMGFYGYKASTSENKTDWGFVFDTASGDINHTGSITAKSFSGSLSGNASSATRLASARSFTIGNATTTFDGTGNISLSLSTIGAAEKNHDHTSVGDGTVKIYPERTDELNFGGTGTAARLWIGCRAKDKRPMPTEYIFGGTEHINGLATLRAKAFVQNGQPVANANHSHSEYAKTSHDHNSLYYTQGQANTKFATTVQLNAEITDANRFSNDLFDKIKKQINDSGTTEKGASEGGFRGYAFRFQNGIKAYTNQFPIQGNSSMVVMMPSAFITKYIAMPVVSSCVESGSHSTLNRIAITKVGTKSITINNYDSKPVRISFFVMGE